MVIVRSVRQPLAPPTDRTTSSHWLVRLRIRRKNSFLDGRNLGTDPGSRWWFKCILKGDLKYFVH